MGEGHKLVYHDTSSPLQRSEHYDELCDVSVSSISANSDDSTFSSSSDHTDDTASSSHHSNGPLYELSSLMDQLPIKRGLSKYYEGRSQSYTSLSNVRCLEDLAKKESPYRRRMKLSKSYGGGLDANQKPNFSRGPCSKTISKKASRSSCSSLAVLRRSSSNLHCSSKPPPIPVHKNLSHFSLN
ncbi:hypothetical protein J5N97_012907 [Dioscorea zingiberensis]|uniref:Oxidative stress 3 n=1 Tax=Dioscorea zingiberensis TaxID=325984 RepID=A0A9D5HIA4_9LILI|nr:hypothetical protein J5N97_012907 [Dioscorea zingiberensis]